MSGRAAARKRVAVLSVKMQTPSTLASAASTAARSASELTGRPAPFNCPTALSLFTPISSASPRFRAASRYVTWPRCRMSKQPFVTTSFLPAARTASRHAGSWSHEMIFSRKVIGIVWANRGEVGKLICSVGAARQYRPAGPTLQRFLRVMNAHHAAEEVDDAHVGQSEFAQLCGHAVLRGIFAERLKDVSMRRGVAAKNFPEQRHETFQVAEINRTPERIVRLAEIEREQPSARRRHARHLAQAGVET